MAKMFFLKIQHITLILNWLHWLPVRFSIDFKTLFFVYKSLHGLTPQCLSDLLSPYTLARYLRSSDQCLLAVPDSKGKRTGGRGFSDAALKLWDELLLHLRQADSIPVLKSPLETRLFFLRLLPQFEMLIYFVSFIFLCLIFETCFFTFLTSVLYWPSIPSILSNFMHLLYWWEQSDPATNIFMSNEQIHERIVSWPVSQKRLWSIEIVAMHLIISII